MSSLKRVVMIFYKRHTSILFDATIKIYEQTVSQKKTYISIVVFTGVRQQKIQSQEEIHFFVRISYLTCFRQQ